MSFTTRTRAVARIAKIRPQTPLHARQVSSLFPPPTGFCEGSNFLNAIWPVQHTRISSFI